MCQTDRARGRSRDRKDTSFPASAGGSAGAPQHQPTRAAKDAIEARSRIRLLFLAFGFWLGVRIGGGRVRLQLRQNLVEQGGLASVDFRRRRLLVPVVVVAIAGSAAH